MIEATPKPVFSVLADPSSHADIDGTGWVRDPLDGDRITAAGQVFRMAINVFEKSIRQATPPIYTLMYVDADACPASRNRSTPCNPLAPAKHRSMGLEFTSTRNETPPS